MKILVAGATGATGQLLVDQLLNAGHEVKIIVRSPGKLPQPIRESSSLTVIQAGILDLSVHELAEITMDCDAIASCLGHNLTFKGVFGPPRRLVTEATRQLCNAVSTKQKGEKTRFVLMNTAGNSNRDLNEPLSMSHRFVVSLIRLLIPPHADNEQAADYLRTSIGQENQFIEWVAVRPDSLINNDEVTEYEIHSSPTSSAIFNPGKTSRINVAHFMAELITNDELWATWKGKMPVIYNKG